MAFDIPQPRDACTRDVQANSTNNINNQTHHHHTGSTEKNQTRMQLQASHSMDCFTRSSVGVHVTTKVQISDLPQQNTYLNIPCRQDPRASKLAMASNRGAYVCGIDDLQVREYSIPPILSPYQVRVRIKAVGICGSDVHYVKHMRIGPFEVKAPMVIGHESAGVIEEVGSGVQNLGVGDRVALEPGVPCWKCGLCKQGLYNLCPEMAFFATPPVHGSLAEAVVHPAAMCFKLPENVSLEEGAMCEPLSVAVHACRRAQVPSHSLSLSILSK